MIIILFLLSSITFANSTSKNITLQLSWFDQFQFAGYYIAKEKGFYKEAGLEVKINPFEFGIDIPKEVGNSTYDFAVGRETLILEKSNNKKIVALYALFQASPLILLTTKESKIKNISDFNHKRIMTTIDDAGEVSIKSMMISQKINLNNLSFIQHTHNINDLVENKVDIISAYSSKAPYHLLNKGIKYNTFAPKDYGFDMYSDLLYTNESNITHNLEMVLNFKKASLKGWEYAYENIDEAVDLILSKYNTQELTREELLFEAKKLKELSYYETESLGNIDLNKLQRIYDLYNVMGLITNQIQIKDFVLVEESFSLFIKEIWNNLSKYIELPYIYFFIILFILLVLLIIYKHVRLLDKEKQLLVKNDALFKNKRKLDEVLEASGEGIWDWNIKTNHIEHNRTWFEILGLDYTKDITTDITTLIHPEDKEGVLKSIENTLNDNSKSYQSEYRLFKKNGDIVWVMDKGSIVEWDEEGNPLRMAGSFSDVTERKKVQEQLEEQHIRLINSEKMASIGEMIGNIAHQWRQPLSIISTASTGIVVQKEHGIFNEDTLIDTCNAINDNAQYLSKTIDDFRNFIKGDVQSSKFNLKNDTASFLKLIDSSIKNNYLDVVLDLTENINIHGYPNELIQCFINIFNNAKDALTENNEEGDRYIFISQETVNNNVVIKFKDNAGGIPKNIIHKVFEPYFTTKHQSQGTGLGLHMTYNFIVDVMEGNIKVHNVAFEYNKQKYIGAEFVITLPFQ
ncbi:ABC transporter substrate-binding protein [Arcobacteraceae bacterium]|nr:ABC transporter substrate-binding protein [Arcobacteraceae bacterium]